VVAGDIVTHLVYYALSDRINFDSLPLLLLLRSFLLESNIMGELLPIVRPRPAPQACGHGRCFLWYG
jgi:hypothetical protein